MGYEYLPGYERVASFANDDYEWAELRVFRKDGRLFYAEGSGCSCTCFEDQVEECDLIELQSLSGAQNALKAFLDGHRYYFTDQIDVYLDGVEKFRELGLR